MPSYYRNVKLLRVIENSGESSSSNVAKAVMKTSILGVITGIQKFSRRNIYTVDDGTGLINCVLWNNKSVATEKINQIRVSLSTDNKGNIKLNPTCHSLLNKIQIDEEEPNYIHGDTICCLGVVKLVNGKLLLDINHHYKTDDVNAETLWILDILSCHQIK